MGEFCYREIINNINNILISMMILRLGIYGMNPAAIQPKLIRNIRDLGIVSHLILFIIEHLVSAKEHPDCMFYNIITDQFP